VSSQEEVPEQGDQATQEIIQPGDEAHLAKGENTSFSAEGQEETSLIESNLPRLDDRVEQEEDDDDDDEDGDGDEEEEADAVDMLVAIEEAKSLVELSERKSRKRKALSPVWKVIKAVRIRDLNLFDDLRRLDSQAHQKLFAANNEGKELCVCANRATMIPPHHSTNASFHLHAPTLEKQMVLET